METHPITLLGCQHRLVSPMHSTRRSSALVQRPIRGKTIRHCSRSHSSHEQCEWLLNSITSKTKYKKKGQELAVMGKTTADALKLQSAVHIRNDAVATVQIHGYKYGEHEANFQPHDRDCYTWALPWIDIRQIWTYAVQTENIVNIDLSNLPFATTICVRFGDDIA